MQGLDEPEFLVFFLPDRSGIRLTYLALAEDGMLLLCLLSTQGCLFERIKVVRRHNRSIPISSPRKISKPNPRSVWKEEYRELWFICPLQVVACTTTTFKAPSSFYHSILEVEEYSTYSGRNEELDRYAPFLSQAREAQLEEPSSVVFSPDLYDWLGFRSNITLSFSIGIRFGQQG